MYYSIYSKVLERSVIKTVKEVREMEAFLKGMKMDYTIIYPSGNEVEVKFKQLEMATINELQDKIDQVKIQLEHLVNNKTISSLEKEELTKYYHDLLFQYETSKEDKIKAIEVVEASEIETNCCGKCTPNVDECIKDRYSNSKI